LAEYDLTKMIDAVDTAGANDAPEDPRATVARRLREPALIPVLVADVRDANADTMVPGFLNRCGPVRDE
jgi:hypothetical protein